MCEIKKILSFEKIFSPRNIYDIKEREREKYIDSYFNIYFKSVKKTRF